jgi:hypothetical protein
MGVLRGVRKGVTKAGCVSKAPVAQVDDSEKGMSAISTSAILEGLAASVLGDLDVDADDEDEDEGESGDEDEDEDADGESSSESAGVAGLLGGFEHGGAVVAFTKMPASLALALPRFWCSTPLRRSSK